MTDSRNPDRPTVYPPAVWRRLAEEFKTDEDFGAELVEHAQLDNAADGAIRAELVQLAVQLYDLLLDRAQRIMALGRLLPQARGEREALALAGFVWADTGFPESFPLEGRWLPRELGEARKLLVWLQAHPSRLPHSDATEISPAEC
jgi:hypothetical protein